MLRNRLDNPYTACKHHRNTHFTFLLELSSITHPVTSFCLLLFLHLTVDVLTTMLSLSFITHNHNDLSSMESYTYRCHVNQFNAPFQNLSPKFNSLIGRISKTEYENEMPLCRSMKMNIH